MRFFVFLFPLLVYSILPQDEMSKISKQFYDSNTSFISTHEYKQSKYYIIVNSEEKFSSNDKLEEDIPYLKAGIQETLFKFMKKKYPKLISIKVSKLLYGSFWDSNNFFHAIAQVNMVSVKPVYETENAQITTTINNVNKNSSSQSDNLTQFSISNDTNRKILLEKINNLEKKSKRHPSNIKILNKLKILYKQAGDTEEYSRVNDRIMDIKMSI